MIDTSIDILVILNHRLKLYFKVSETALRIRKTGKTGKLCDCTALEFMHFIVGNLSFEIKPKVGGLSVVDYDDLKIKIEENSTTITG